MTPITKKRRPVVACLLTLLEPGVGFLYVGRPWLAAAFPFVPFVLLLVFRLSGVVLLPWGAAAIWATWTLGWLAVTVWNGFTARKAGEVALAPYQRWYVYVGYHVVIIILVFLFPYDTLDWLGARVYRIPSISMSDTLLKGDYIVVDTWAYVMGRKPQRGDIVVYTLPMRPGVRYTKRVIGLPGDQIDGRGRQIYINQVKLDEPYLNPAYNIPLGTDWHATVPADSYFVVGDNRYDSEDSRLFGAIPGDKLFGRVRAICAALDAQGELSFDRVAAVK